MNRFTKEFLEEEYINKNRTIQDIAQEYNVSPRKLWNIKKDFGLYKVNKTSEKLTKEYLIEEYLVKDRSAKDIAKENGTTNAYTMFLIRQYGLKTKLNYRTAKCKVGQRFGKIVVLSRDLEYKSWGTAWKCQCDCGEIFTCVKLFDSKTCKKCLLKNMKSQKSNKNKHWKGYEDIDMHYWGHIKGGAKYRNLEFSISIEYVWDIFIKQNKTCNLTGLPLYFKNGDLNNHRGIASLDRIDSTKGYIEGNVQWIHKDLQRIKWNLPEKKLLDWAEKLVAYRNLKRRQY